MAVKLNLADLTFVLKQIKIAEAHSNGAALTEIRLDAAGNVITDPAAYGPDGAYLGDPGAPRAIPDPHVPNGLRTVDGSYNNLVPGRELWGAADQTMPRLLDPNYRDGGPEDPFDTNGPTIPGGIETNTDYGNPGNVIDSDPRLISNLIVDMSFNNPAAIVSALMFAESEDPYGDLVVVQQGHATLMAILSDPGATPEAKEAAQAAFDALLDSLGLETSNGSLVIPNVAPDEGISAPFNAWMTFFGQFFDHGLDLINKGNNGTIFVPLKPDDPLITHGPDGIPDTGDEVPPQLQFMVLTRATPVDENGVAQHVNQTTPFVDQNQTYTSHASHQVFLREYALNDDGVPVATGRLLEGQNGGLATWADIKAQARDLLGIELTDADVLNIPLLRTDPYGEFIRGANGLPQIVVGLGPDGIPNTDDDEVVSGNLATPVNTVAAGAFRIGHAFLDDIAHNANPFNSNTGGLKAADLDDAIGLAGSSQAFYDDELLDRHFITGDGRGNENFGLTAVHQVFHSEHNRQVTVNKLTILQDGDLAFVNEWLLTDITQTQLNAIKANLAAATNLQTFVDNLTLDWDGERLFQTARFATEMQYQHLVFEEFARKVQPAIDPFIFNNLTDVNPAIFAEFANTVYRFGHSMLTDSMPRVYADNTTDDVGLIAAFLNPLGFDHEGTISHDEAAGALVRGLTGERGNAIDEFVVGALRNNLLGLPLDLAAINIARGRDTGIPTLNDARAQLYAATGSSFLKPYDSWVEFAANLKNPLSIVNFIAAYGTHASITGAATAAEKRDAAMALVFGGDGAPADRLAFLNATGAYATGKGGLDNVDLWIGGLAEKILLFGGMLGSTFNAVFELQLENLQDGDRLYYLTRTQGLNFLNELENNAFSKLIMANTDLSDPGPDGIRGTDDDIIRHHIGIDSFANYDYVLEVDEQYQLIDDPEGIDPVLEALGLGKVIRYTADPTDDHPGLPPQFAAFYDNYLRFTGGEHVVLGGTSGNDVLIGDLGDDAIWGDAGDDYIEGGQGVDLIMGGAGDDIILDMGDTGDFIKGDSGDDVIANSNGLDVLMGGSGKDVVFVGVDDTEVFGGEGDDFILGGDGLDFLLGNEGDDWIEGGGGFDTIAGDNSELFFNSRIIGHDVMFAGADEQDFDAESGDDIMVQGESVIRNEGMFGFDWAIFKGVARDAYADMRINIFTTEEEDILRNRFDKVEALSGWEHNDTLIGDDRVFGEFPAIPTVNNTENIFFRDELDQAGIARIAGLDQIVTSNLLRNAVYGADFSDEVKPIFTGGNILLGGGGSDTITGRGGDDVIDGDAWLNVRIRITGDGQANTPGNEIATIDSLKHTFTADDAGDPSWIGRSLFELLVDRVIKPNQLHIVREILWDDSGVDTAVFWDNVENYTFTLNLNGSVTVDHTGFDEANVPQGPEGGRLFVSDGRDTLSNIELFQFGNGTFTLAEIIEGVDPPDDPPPPENAVPLTSTTPEIHPLDLDGNVAPAAPGEEVFGFLDIGTDTDLDSLNFFLFTGAPVVGGSVEITVDGFFVFTPEADFVGDASFFYVLRDYSETDGDGLPIYKSESAPKQVTIVYGSAVPDPDPDPDPEPQDFSLTNASINEIALNGTVVGLLALINPGGAFSLVSDAGGRFTVVGNELRVANGLLLDFEQQTSHDISVLWSDGIDSIEKSFTIAVQDVNPEVVVGDSGSYTFVGGALNDTLTSGAGIDTLRGAGGHDTYYVNSNSDRVEEASGQGTDTIYASVNYKIMAGSHVEILRADAGSTDLTLIGNAFANTLYSGDGNDTLRGGNGNDVYYVNSGSDRVVEAFGQGTDTVYTSANYKLMAGSYVEVLRAIAGTDNINLTGNQLANRIVGNDGNNVIAGGRGNDVLTGGVGSDTFVFNTALNGQNNVDRITDFNVAADTIQLENAIFRAFASLSTGQTISSASFLNAAGATAAQDASDRIVYNRSTGDLYYDADGVGGVGAIKFATLNAGLNLTHNDFVII